MLDLFGEIFSYEFMVRAIIVGSLVALCSSLLGVSLVLKKYSMIGDGLSHVAFGALAVAVACNAAPLYIAIPVVVIAAFILLRISENSKIKSDAAIGLISTVSIAIGVITISLSKGMNSDLNSYMFGSILAMNSSDVILSMVLSICVLVIFIFFYNKMFAITFDENFAKATGIKAERFKMILSILTAITIVIGMRLMGTMLISSLIIFPSLTAMHVCKTFKSVVITSGIVSVICLFFGVVLSYVYAIPTGASIVVANAVMFVIFWITKKITIK